MSAPESFDESGCGATVVDCRDFAFDPFAPLLEPARSSMFGELDSDLLHPKIERATNA
jgi:hypothetical protein